MLPRVAAKTYWTVTYCFYLVYNATRSGRRRHFPIVRPSGPRSINACKSTISPSGPISRANRFHRRNIQWRSRIRAGFIPATRREVFAKIKGLKIAKCPFTNLPEREPGRWGQGLTAEKMKSCIWVKLVTVVRIDLAEWTGADKLRLTKFVALRDDKAYEAFSSDVKHLSKPTSITSVWYEMCFIATDLWELHIGNDTFIGVKCVVRT